MCLIDTEIKAKKNQSQNYFKANTTSKALETGDNIARPGNTGNTCR